MNLLDNSYGHRYISLYVPPANYALSSGGNSMRQFVARVFPEPSSGRAACSFITLELLCLVSPCGRAAYGQAPTGVAFDESSLNTNLWTVCTPDVDPFNADDLNRDGRMGVISAKPEGSQYGPVPPEPLISWQARTDRRNGTWIKHTINPNMVDVHKIPVRDMEKHGSQDMIMAKQAQAPLRRGTV
jgi:hypothetical protein